jgi:hypothetical protein
VRLDPPTSRPQANDPQPGGAIDARRAVLDLMPGHQRRASMTRLNGV